MASGQVGRAAAAAASAALKHGASAAPQAVQQAATQATQQGQGQAAAAAMGNNLLKVFFSNKYAYASILQKQSPSDPGHYVAAASTLQRDVREALAAQAASHSDVRASGVVGRMLAERAREAGVQEVRWDNHRGLKYGGKVQALIEALRANGLRVK